MFGGTGRPFERGAADGAQAVVRLLVVLDDKGGGIN
jgi:alpha-D-ribose 1-methylphosphonate 5-triphosphate synthase subunit PhnG